MPPPCILPPPPFQHTITATYQLYTCLLLYWLPTYPHLCLFLICSLFCTYHLILPHLSPMHFCLEEGLVLIVIPPSTFPLTLHYLPHLILFYLILMMVRSVCCWWCCVPCLGVLLFPHSLPLLCIPVLFCGHTPVWFLYPTGLLMTPFTTPYIVVGTHPWFSFFIALPQPLPTFLPACHPLPGTDPLCSCSCACSTHAYHAPSYPFFCIKFTTAFCLQFLMPCCLVAHALPSPLRHCSQAFCL